MPVFFYPMGLCFYFCSAPEIYRLIYIGFFSFLVDGLHYSSGVSGICFSFHFIVGPKT